MSQTFPDPDPFPEDLIDRLIQQLDISASRTEQFREDLRDLPFEVQTYQARNFIPQKAQLIRELSPVVNAGVKILNKLNAANVTGKMPLHPDQISPQNAQILWEYARNLNPRNAGGAVDDGSAREAFQADIQAVARLRTAIQNTLNCLELEQEIGKGGDRSEGDVALCLTLKLLLVVYEDATEKTIGFTTNSIDDKTYGPLVEFIQTCLEVVGWDIWSTSYQHMSSLYWIPISIRIVPFF